MPDKFAPKHRPVDIAPHPEYRSSNVTTFFSLKDGESGSDDDIVDDDPLAALSFSSGILTYS